MQSQRLRVVLGSDGATARDVLAGLVEKQSGVVVGQGVNATEVIALARSLRPDVVIVDCHLPHTFGLTQVPLSRAGGLDTAQLISAEIPNTRVLLIGNLDAPPPPELIANPELMVSLYSARGASSTPLVLADLPAADRTPIFARILTRKLVTRSRFARLAEEVTLLGMVGIVLGMMMMVTGILFVPGVIMAALGGAGALLGFMGRLVIRYLVPQERHVEIRP